MCPCYSSPEMFRPSPLGVFDATDNPMLSATKAVQCKRALVYTGHCGAPRMSASAATRRSAFAEVSHTLGPAERPRRQPVKPYPPPPSGRPLQRETKRPRWKVSGGARRTPGCRDQTGDIQIFSPTLPHLSHSGSQAVVALAPDPPTIYDCGRRLEFADPQGGQGLR